MNHRAINLDKIQVCIMRMYVKNSLINKRNNTRKWMEIDKELRKN